jgi:outer membrane immunogenic protein
LLLQSNTGWKSAECPAFWRAENCIQLSMNITIRPNTVLAKVGAPMRKYLISAIAVSGFILAASGSAFAADIAVKAPPPAPPPAFSWTGWYVGVNGGLAAQSKDSHVTGFNGDDVFIGGPTTTGGAVIDPVGGFGGGQIGYNWQTAPNWVVGLEADIQGGSIQKSATAVVAAGVASPDSPLVASATNKLDWFGTVRARVGYTFLDQRVLTYVTGGFAFGGVRDSLSVAEISEGALLFGSTGSNTTKTGWIVGYGIEGYFTPALSLRVESDYMSLGSSTLATGTNCDENCANDIPFATANLNHKYWLLRAGLNYKFGTW